MEADEPKAAQTKAELSSAALAARGASPSSALSHPGTRAGARLRLPRTACAGPPADFTGKPEQLLRTQETGAQGATRFLTTQKL